MKHKISISVDEDTLLRVQAGVRARLFRSKSHAFEYAVHRLLEDLDKGVMER